MTQATTMKPDSAVLWLELGIAQSGLKSLVIWALSRGFLVANSSMNKYGSTCNSVTSAEAVMMLKEAITEGKKGGGTLSLLVKTGDHYKTAEVDYHGGLRYPRLERIDGTPDLLSAIYAPKK